MDDFLAYSVLGICLGSIYAIAATGLVVTYTTSGIFNFAHGAIGMLSAIFYWQVRFGWHWPGPIAIAVTVCVFAPLVGALIEILIMRGLRGTSEVTQIVVPVAVLLAVNGAATWIWFRTGQDLYLPTRFFGETAKVEIGGQVVSWHQLVAVILAIVIAAGLYLLLYHTRLGVTMRATVDDRNLLMMNGGRPDRMSLVSWAIGAGMAGLAGVLLAPSLGALQVIALTLLVFDSYPAAIVGRLKSVPLAYAGGIAFGLAKQYWDWASDVGSRWPAFVGVRTALPAILLFVVLLLLPQERLRGAVVTRTRERFNVPSMRQAVLWGVVLLAVMAGLQAIMENSAVITLSRGLALSLMALPLVLLTGYGGQVNFAAYSFAGIAVIAAWQFDVGPSRIATQTQESLSVPAILLAVVVCALVGGLVALPALRLRGLYLGLATFAFAIIVDKLVIRQQDALRPEILGLDEVNLFTNGTLTVPRPNWFGVDFLDSQRNMLMLLTAAFALIGIGIILIRRSAFGRTVIAMKDSPAACATLGLNIVRTKLAVFMIASGLAGFCGLLWTAQERNVNNNGTFDPFLGLALFLITVVGGIGYVSGALLAGIFIAVLGSIMPEIFEKLGEDYPSLEWLFVDAFGNFAKFLGVAIAGIGLGRNPSGVAQQLMDGYRPLRKAPGAVAVWAGAVVVLWFLAWREMIGNWTFTLVLAASFLVVPGRIMAWVHPDRFGEELAHKRGPDMDRAGLDASLTPTDRDRLDTAMGLPSVALGPGVGS